MPQKQNTYQCDHNEFFDQFVGKVFHCPIDQLTAIVGGHNLHALGQAGFELIELGVYRLEGRARVLAAAQNDHAANRFTLAIQFRDAAPYLRSELDMCHLAQQHRHAIHQLERDSAEIRERLEITGGAHHQLGLAEREYRSTGLLIRPRDGIFHFRLCNAETGELDRVEYDLILLDHAAYSGHFGNIGQGFQLEFQEPVLQGAQLRQIVLSGFVDQRVFVNPADASGIGTQA